MKYNKFIQGVFSIVLLFTIFFTTQLFGTLNVQAYQIFHDGDYEYYVLDNEAVITSVSYYASGDITIPSTLGEYKVTSIDYEAFYNCRNIEHITIPDTITTIGERAFHSCTKLKSITVGKNIANIGKNAFYNTPYYNVTSNWENGVLYIGDYLIKSNTSIVGSYGIKTGTKVIADWAFEDCSNLEGVILPETVTNIGDNAFAYCDSLENVEIPKNVSKIGDRAFRSCYALQSVIVDADNKNYCSDQFGVLFNKSKNTLIKYPQARMEKSYSIPSSVVDICDWAFADSWNLESIIIPESVTSIGERAFTFTNLKSVLVSKNVTHIGELAFYGCSTLESVVVDMDNQNFYSDQQGVLYNKNATELILCPSKSTNCDVPNTVINISSYAFDNCSILESVHIPSSIIYVGTGAFHNCGNLKYVFYSEDESKKTGIAIEYYNDSFKKAVWHYDSVGHSFEWIIDNEENCGTNGIKHKECTVCQASHNENTIIPATNKHEYDNACDEKCNACNQTRIVPDHIYENDCDDSCNVCNASRIITHSYEWIIDKTVDCGIDGIKHEECSICHEKVNENTIILATGKHTYDNDCDIECNICKQIRTINHNFKWAIDTKENCGFDGIKHEECTVCHIKRNENTVIPATGNHKYTNSCDTICDVCNETRTITHSYKTTTTKATTSKDGKIVKKCTVCDNVASSTTIKYAKTFTLSTTSYTYNGKVKTPTVTVKDSSGKTLKKDTDFTVTYASGRKNAGTYNVTITMKGNYTGSKTLSFKINPISVSKCEIALSKTSYTYDGKSKVPSVTVLNHNGTKLTDSSYTITYAKGRKNVGTYKVIVKMKGNYSGTKTLSFKINPVKTTVSKLTAGKKSITVAINKKSTQVTGYQIQYSTSKKFTNAKAKTISSYKTTKYTIKSLSAKKTYYVRVRTYKTVNGKKYYSGWSTYKYIKTK